MTNVIDLTTRETRWRARAAQLAGAMPAYRGSRGRMLVARMPGAVPEGPALDLAPGDVVSFRFPHLDKRPDGDANRTNRPGLIVERDDATDSVLVAYGTSRRTGANSGHEIRVYRDFAGCGLAKPTRFVLARRIRVSSRDARFVWLGGRPVPGRLPEPLMQRLDRLRHLLTELYGDEELRHVHEWIGANCRDDRITIAAAIHRLRAPQQAAA